MRPDNRLLYDQLIFGTIKSKVRLLVIASLVRALRLLPPTPRSLRVSDRLEQLCDNNQNWSSARAPPLTQKGSVEDMTNFSLQNNNETHSY